MGGASASSESPPRWLAERRIPNSIWVSEGLPDISAVLVPIAGLDPSSPMNAIAIWILKRCRIEAAEHGGETTADAENHSGRQIIRAGSNRWPGCRLSDRWHDKDQCHHSGTAGKNIADH